MKRRRRLIDNFEHRIWFHWEGRILAEPSLLTGLVKDAFLSTQPSEPMPPRSWFLIYCSRPDGMVLWAYHETEDEESPSGAGTGKRTYAIPM